MRKPFSTYFIIAVAIAISAALEISVPAQPAANSTGAAITAAPLTNNPATGVVNPPPTEGTAPAPKPKRKVKKQSVPVPAKADQKVSSFDGKLSAVDKTAMTITVESGNNTNSHTLKITSNTRINKDNKPALLAEGKIGEAISGQMIKSADGNEEAVVVNFGVHRAAPVKRKHKPAQPKAKSETPEGLTPGTDTNQAPTTTTEAPSVPPSK